MSDVQTTNGGGQWKTVGAGSTNGCSELAVRLMAVQLDHGREKTLRLDPPRLLTHAQRVRQYERSSLLYLFFCKRMRERGGGEMN